MFNLSGIKAFPRRESYNLITRNGVQQANKDEQHYKMKLPRQRLM